MTRRIMCICGLVFAGAIEAAADDQWRTLFDRGNTAEVIGDYAGAAAHYREAARLAEAFDLADPRRVLSLNGLGMMNDALGHSPMPRRHTAELSPPSTGRSPPAA